MRVPRASDARYLDENVVGGAWFCVRAGVSHVACLRQEHLGSPESPCSRAIVYMHGARWDAFFTALEAGSGRIAVFFKATSRLGRNALPIWRLANPREWLSDYTSGEQ